MTPDGRVALVTRDGDLRPVFQARLDIIDLASASTIASSRQDGLFLRFLDDGSLIELERTEDWNPQLAIWRLTLITAEEGGSLH